MNLGHVLPADVMQEAFGKIPAEAEFPTQVAEDFFDGIPGPDAFLPGLVQAPAQPLAVLRLDDGGQVLTMSCDLIVGRYRRRFHWAQRMHAPHFFLLHPLTEQLFDLLQSAPLRLEDELQHRQHDQVDKFRIVTAMRQHAALLTPLGEVLAEGAGRPSADGRCLALQQGVAPRQQAAGGRADAVDQAGLGDRFAVVLREASDPMGPVLSQPGQAGGLGSAAHQAATRSSMRGISRYSFRIWAALLMMASMPRRLAWSPLVTISA